MLLTKQSELTGIFHTLEIPITEDQLNKYYESNNLIQSEFPQLTEDEREFILTGITHEEWYEFFSENDLI